MECGGIATGYHRTERSDQEEGWGRDCHFQAYNIEGETVVTNDGEPVEGVTVWGETEATCGIKIEKASQEVWRTDGTRCLLTTLIVRLIVAAGWSVEHTSISCPSVCTWRPATW